MGTQGEGRVPGPTVRDVARVAGVSVGTVSRVLNAAPSVRQHTREAVLDAVRALGYEPNTIARALRMARTGTIGVLVHDVIHTMSGVAVQGAQRAAAARGYSVFVGETGGAPEDERRLVQAMVGRRVDGILTLPVGSRQGIAEALSAAGTPVVFFGQLSPRAGTHSAVIAEEAATVRALEDLWGHGHRRFALVGDLRAGAFLRARSICGWLDARPGAAVTVIREPHEQISEAVGRAIAGPDRPSAFVVLVLRSVPPVLLAAREAGLAIPRDLSLVTYGDSDWAEAHTPPIHVITTDYGAHVEKAAHLLIDLVEGRPEPAAPILDVSAYIARGSVGPAPV